MSTRSSAPSSAARRSRGLLLGAVLVASAFAPAASAFEGWEHQDVGDVGGGQALLRGWSKLDPTLAFPWRDRQGRVLVSLTPKGPRVAAGQAFRGVSFGELVAMYADVVDQGAGRTAPAFDQMAGATDKELLGFETAIGRFFGGFFSIRDPNLHGRGLELLAVNQTHFDDDAMRAYLRWHGEALKLAAEAARTSDLSLLWKALHLDALGLHSLSDLFATGHIILDRKASLALQKGFDALNTSQTKGVDGTINFLRQNLTSFIFDRTKFKIFWDKLVGAGLSIFTGLLHDSFNSNGAIVQSLEHPEGWWSFGDSFYGMSPSNVQYVRTAAYRSVRAVLEAYVAFRTRVDPKKWAAAVKAVVYDPAYYQALKLVPIHYNGAQRFQQPTSAKSWAGVILAAFNKFAGYGAESLGAKGFLPMTPKMTADATYRGLVQTTLSSKVSLSAYFGRGRPVAPSAAPDLSIAAHPYDSLIVGLGVYAPFSYRNTLIHGTLQEIYGSLARIAYKSGGENWARLNQIQPAGPGNLPAPTAPNHSWKIGDRVSAPFKTTSSDFVNGTVREVYGKLIRIDFDTKDTGWALGLRARHEQQLLIPAQWHPRAVLQPLLNKIDPIGVKILGQTGYAWLRDTIDGVVSRMTERVFQLGHAIKSGFSDAIHMTHSNCIEKHVPDLARGLAQTVQNEALIAAEEFWGRISGQDLASSPDLRAAVAEAWRRVVADIATLQARSMEDGITKIGHWYPINKTNRAKAVAVFQQVYAKGVAGVKPLLERYGTRVAGR